MDAETAETLRLVEAKIDGIAARLDLLVHNLEKLTGLLVAHTDAAAVLHHAHNMLAHNFRQFRQRTRKRNNRLSDRVTNLEGVGEEAAK